MANTGKLRFECFSCGEMFFLSRPELIKASKNKCVGCGSTAIVPSVGGKEKIDRLEYTKEFLNGNSNFRNLPDKKARRSYLREQLVCKACGDYHNFPSEYCEECSMEKYEEKKGKK